ncbi:MAG: methyltransferase domain-containing protein [Helicobacteraceae bacterium]|nr:methyltransferase domain-containing protein [Helicobacteraceae bacterium]
MQKDLFKDKSKTFNKESKRYLTAKKISDNIIEDIELNKNMEILDFGAGTGLLSLGISDHVKKITAIDISASMLKEFKNSSKEFGCEVELINKDLTNENLEIIYDGIISSMTLHHIKNIKDIFEKFYKLIKKDGFLSLADLESENGTFHSDNEGVFHFGFKTDELVNIAKEVGFKNVTTKISSTLQKDNNKYSIFLLSAKK